MKKAEILRNFEEIHTRLAKLEGIILQLTKENNPSEIHPYLNLSGDNLTSSCKNYDIPKRSNVAKKSTGGILRRNEETEECDPVDSDMEGLDVTFKVEIDDEGTNGDEGDLFLQDVGDNVEIFKFESEDSIYIPENDELSESDQEFSIQLEESKEPPPPSKAIRTRKHCFAPLKVPPFSSVADGPVVRMERLSPSLLPPPPPRPKATSTTNSCLHCPKTLSSRQRLLDHIRNFHTSPYPVSCPHCHTPWKDQATLSTHVRLSHPDLPKPLFPCPECPSVLKNQEAFKRHLRNHLPPSEKQHKCPHCTHTSSESSNMRHHILTHTGERPYPCPHCSAKYRSNAALKQHILVQHVGGIKKYSCPHCSEYRTHRMSNLKSHLAHVHEQREKDWLCDKCTSAFKFRKQLNYHVRNVHEKEFSVGFKCYFCRKMYKDRSALKKHLSRHTREKCRKNIKKEDQSPSEVSLNAEKF